MAHGPAAELRKARKTVARVAKAVERGGLKVEWVRRLAKRLAKLGLRRTPVPSAPASGSVAPVLGAPASDASRPHAAQGAGDTGAPRSGRSVDSAAGVPAST
jgi:hypothetical protein